MTDITDFEPEWFTDRLRQFQGFKEMLLREHPQTFMLVETPFPYGKTWLLKKMAYHCRDSEPVVPAVYIDFRNPLIDKVDDFQVVQLLSESFEAPAFFQPLFAEVARHGEDDAWLPVGAMQRLVDEILVSFNSEGQLKLLFRYVDANYDLLPGDGGLEKTFEFVAFCLRRNSLDQLLETLVGEREDRADSWRALIADIEKAAAESMPDLPIGGFAKLTAPDQEREHIMQAVTAVFIACLENYLGQLDRLVLLLDSYEDSTHEAQRWLEKSFVPHLTREKIKAGLIMVIAGRQTFYVNDPEVRKLILRDQENQLYPEKYYVGVFSEEHIAEYIEKRKIEADWATPEKLMVFTEGNPDLLGKIFEQKTMS
ncbi:MAG: hypothetical protein ACK2UV_11245 [Candidatus Promineifilaceae bacterium]